LLSEKRAGEAWKNFNKAMLFLVQAKVSLTYLLFKGFYFLTKEILNARRKIFFLQQKVSAQKKNSLSFASIGRFIDRT
jgi:hypothetical protein